MRFLRTAVPAFAALLATLIATATPAAAVESGDLHDPFYSLPPGGVTAGAGEVIQHRAAEFRIEPTGLINQRVRSWQLLYGSADAEGRRIAVSGTLLVPEAPYAGPGPRPVVAHAIGTHGLGDRCAPSRALAGGTQYETILIKAMLDRGWAVVATDYQGLGTAGGHSYVNGRAEGQAVLDSVRAAQRLPGAGIAPDAPVVIAGYSQGGQAASWAAELQPSYAPELKLRGASVGAPAADLLLVAKGVDGTPAFGFGLTAAVGLKHAYPELPLEELFTDHGRELLADISDDCTLQIAAKYGMHSWDRLTTEDPFTRPDWRGRLAEQRAGQQRPAVPVRLYHSRLDDVIPYRAGTELKDRLCGLGASVDWDTYLTPTHMATFYAAAPATVGWLADRIEGRPAENDC
ncbi:lipase family protein [Streptomyces sp. NBC_00091]|uniref:lipase family protein n=1 Tax=Streptomyces sp. NBC_00091 TaxID=2975648 RepID=UPI002256B009|nr:lipase family protein [Streptomyces sp. NBC_00091]MCX5379771.1 lipase family protein [Streptomyces sp. NBC_00091]